MLLRVAYSQGVVNKLIGHHLKAFVSRQHNPLYLPDLPSSMRYIVEKSAVTKVGLAAALCVYLVETGGSRTPRPEDSPQGYTTGLAGFYDLTVSDSPRPRIRDGQPMVLSSSLIGIRDDGNSMLWRPMLTLELGQLERATFLGG